MNMIARPFFMKGHHSERISFGPIPSFHVL
jgi:hypothetical protein